MVEEESIGFEAGVMADRSVSAEGGNGDRQQNPLDHFFGSLIRDASLIIPSIKERLDPSSHRNQTNGESTVAESSPNREEGDTGNVNDDENQRGVKEIQDLLSSSMNLPPKPLSDYTSETDEIYFLSPSSDTHGGEINQPLNVNVVSPISFEGSPTVSGNDTLKNNVMESGEKQGTTATSEVPQYVESATSTRDDDNGGEISFGGEWSTTEANQVLSKQLSQVQTHLDELRLSHKILNRHHGEECKAKKRLEIRVSEQERTITSLMERNRRLEMQVEGQDSTIMDMRKGVHEKEDKISELQVKVNQSDAKVKELQQQIYFLTIERESWWSNSTLPTGPPSLYQPCSPWNPTGHVDGNFMPYSFSPPRAPPNAVSCQGTLPTSSFFPSPSSAFIPSGTNYPFGAMTPPKPTWLSTPPGFSTLHSGSYMKSNLEVSTENHSLLQ